MVLSYEFNLSVMFSGAILSNATGTRDPRQAQRGAGRQNHEKLIWALVNLEVLHREYRL